MAAADKAAAQAAAEAAEAERLVAEGNDPDPEPQVEEDAEVQVDAGDERLGSGRDDAAEAAKAQKATERKARKERQRLARERLTNENQAFRQKIAQLEQQQAELYQRVTKNDGDSIEARLAEIKHKIKVATTIQAKAARATGATAEADYVEATEIRDQLLKAETTLEQARAWQAQQQQRVEAQPARRPVPETVVRQAQQFASENDWYAPEGSPGRNRESEIADRISASLDLEGFDARTPEYWAELRTRCKSNKVLGHLLPEDDEIEAVESDEDDAQVPRRANGGPRMSAGGRERPLKRGEVYIPRELKENMQEAGIWDDPQKRARVIKNYQATLRAQRAN
jgi:hypothetical protein